jgi:hypothetical protein
MRPTFRKIDNSSFEGRRVETLSNRSHEPRYPKFQDSEGRDHRVDQRI